MATKTWISNSDTDWDTAANWSGGTLPVAGDDVVFNSEGTADCYGPITLTDLTTGSIYVNKDYAGNLGESGTPLAIV